MFKELLLIFVSSVYTQNNTDCPTTTGKFCPVFKDDFNKLDHSRWKHDITLSGGGNWEFQYYSNNRSNSYTKDGILYLKPTLTADNIGAAKVLNGGRIDLTGSDGPNKCTSAADFGCDRSSNGQNVINPIQSARISTLNSFSFMYGRVEVKAKLPKGNWIWPAIWMMPKYNAYGNWPSSGEIDIMESRGNGPDYTGGGVDSIGSTLHWGKAFDQNRYPLTHKEYKLPKGKTFADDFHIFGMEWTPNSFKTYVDTPDNVVLEVPLSNFNAFSRGSFTGDNPWKDSCPQAPFDQEFYLILNVAVGGTSSYFPDGVGGKPWKNTGDNASKDFWSAKDQWLPSWDLVGENSSLQIDSVTVSKMC